MAITLSQEVRQSYILCFKDFQPNKDKRKPCIFLRVIDETGYGKEKIAKKFSGTKMGTAVIQATGVTEGLWGLIAISKEDTIQTVHHTF